LSYASLLPAEPDIAGEGEGTSKADIWAYGAGAGWLCALWKGGESAMNVIERGLVSSQAHTKQCALPITLLFFVITHPNRALFSGPLAFLISADSIRADLVLRSLARAERLVGRSL